MSPSQFHPKREITTNNNGLLPPPLKINKDSHFIKKSPSPPPPPPSSSSSSSSSTSSLMAPAAAPNKPQQRHPVIIYTHSPKIIHTHPRDFMALVQKLTGLSRSEDDGGSCEVPQQPQPKQEPGSGVAVAVDKEGDCKKVATDDTETTSSVITEENNSSSSMGDNQVNSCFMATPPIVEPPLNPYVANLPVFPPSTAEFLCSNQPLLNYSDSLFLCHNMRSSIPLSATLEGMNEIREY